MQTRCLIPRFSLVLSPQALVFLTSVGLAGADGAPKRGAQQRFVATPKGRLVCAMPVGVEHALSVLRGARFGRLREAALCAAIDCTNPAPVPMAYTGETERYGQVVRGFFPKWLGDRDFAGRTLANLAAVEFFETNYLDAARAERLLLAVRSGAAAAAPGASRAAADGNSDGSCVVPTLQDVIDSGVPADESAWCASHGLSRLALRSAMDTADICMRAVWKCRPLFLAGSGGGGGSIRGADGWTTREDEATSGAAQRAIGFEEPFHRCKGHTCSCAKASASSGAAGAVPILADADLCETKTPTLQDLYSEVCPSFRFCRSPFRKRLRKHSFDEGQCAIGGKRPAHDPLCGALAAEGMQGAPRASRAAWRTRCEWRQQGEDGSLPWRSALQVQHPLRRLIALFARSNPRLRSRPSFSHSADGVRM